MSEKRSVIEGREIRKAIKSIAAAASAVVKRIAFLEHIPVVAGQSICSISGFFVSKMIQSLIRKERDFEKRKAVREFTQLLNQTISQH